MVLSGDNSAFAGNVIVDHSNLKVTSDQAFTPGMMIFKNGSVAELAPSTVPINLRLQDSTIWAPQLITGNLSVASNAEFRTAADSRVESHTTFESGLILHKTREDNLIFASEVLIGEGVEVLVHDGKIAFEGTIGSDHENASLNFITEDRPGLSASVLIHNGQSLAITVNGESTPLIVNQPGQSVSGNGTLGNSLILGPGAAISPGASAGVFTVDGDYTQLLDAVMRIELGGTPTGSFDRLVITGLFDAGGVFELLLMNGYVPRAGDAFDILDFGSLAPGSAFDELLLPTLPAGRAWDTSDLLVTGEVRVVPEPTAALWACAVFLLQLRSRRDRRSARVHC